MPNDLTIGRVALPTPPPSPSPPHPSVAATHEPALPSSGGNPNPTLRLDATLGIVVIEFFNGSGAVTTSIPSQQQLRAYQEHSDRQAAPGAGSPSTPSPSAAAAAAAGVANPDIVT